LEPVSRGRGVGHEGPVADGLLEDLRVEPPRRLTVAGIDLLAGPLGLLVALGRDEVLAHHVAVDDHLAEDLVARAEPRDGSRAPGKDVDIERCGGRAGGEDARNDGLPLAAGLEGPVDRLAVLHGGCESAAAQRRAAVGWGASQARGHDLHRYAMVGEHYGGLARRSDRRGDRQVELNGQAVGLPDP